MPTIVGATHEVTRGVVKIRYEGKTQPEIEVAASDDDVTPPTRINLEIFLKSLPAGLDEIFQPYLERWVSGRYIIFWGQVGFSFRVTYHQRPKTIVDAYPAYISLFVEKWLPDWGNPIDAYREYREKLQSIPECQRVFSEGRRYVFYNRLRPEDIRVILEATDRLAEALVILGTTTPPQ